MGLVSTMIKNKPSDSSEIMSLLVNIEEILFNNSIHMKTPTLEEDLGVMLFEATFYKYSKNTFYKKRTITLLEKLIEVFPERNIQFGGFLESFEGLFWCIPYLHNCGIIDETTILDDLIPHLLKSLKIDIRNNEFDVLHGSINKLSFFIHTNYISYSEKVELFNNFIDSLDDSKNETDKGIFWFDEFEGNDGLVNLGLPHGIPSLLIFLTKLKVQGYSNNKSNILLEGIIKFLSNCKMDSPSDSLYSDFYSENYVNKNVSSRLAYCYGDLGIAYAFLYAGNKLVKEELIIEGKTIMESIVKRGVTNSKIDYFEDYFFLDTGFCHGLSGITYILEKINHFLDNSFLERRIFFWKEELIRNLSVQLNIEGNIFYPEHLQLKNSETPFIIDKQSFLTGYTGVGLVLLSLYYKKHDWSDFLLLY